MYSISEKKQRTSSNTTSNAPSKAVPVSGPRATQFINSSSRVTAQRQVQQAISASPVMQQKKVESTLQRVHNKNFDAVAQLQKRRVNSDCNLRFIGNERKKFKIKAGAEVEIQNDVVESQKFKLGFLSGVSYEEGPHHTKVLYDGNFYWIKNSHLGESNNSAIVIPKDKVRLDITSIQSANPISIYEQKKQEKGLDELGAYFEPAAAKVEEKNKMGFAGGGHVGYDQMKDKNYSHDMWHVTAVNGQLCNKNKKVITGGGSWVLGVDGILSGSQRTAQEAFSRDMDSHELANVEDAFWAGEIEVVNGKVKYINNQSGKFHFKAEANVNILTYLLKNNLLSEEDILSRELEIEAWTQEDMDRAGKLQPWNGFKERSFPVSPRVSRARSVSSKSEEKVGVFDMDFY